VDATFGPHGSVGTVPNKPPIVSLAYTYDNASSRTGAFDARPGAEQPLSHMYAYDGLHRLIDARRGVWNRDLGTPSVTPAKWSQEWSLDPLGNWASVTTDGTLPLETETRDHRDNPNGNPENRVNKLMARIWTFPEEPPDPPPPPPPPPIIKALSYDFAGNMLRQVLTKVGTDTTALRFTHDAWNRLVRVEYEELDESGSPPHVPDLFPRGEYEYNGLNWRTVRRFDSNVANTTHELDTEQVLLYDADWRLLERRVNSSYDPMDEEPEIDRIVHHVWGLRYIDDIVATRHDINPSAEDGHELIFFHVTDAQFSTVAILSDTGAVLERVTYTAYGVARHHWPTDVTGDGAVDSADLGAVLNAYGSIDDAEYRSEADFNRDGVVGGADLGAVLTYMTELPDGVLSSAAVNNEIGYAGYQFAPEAGALGAYLARNRWLDPELGRWRQRDPLEYVDGMGLYEYVASEPTAQLDPFGQSLRTAILSVCGRIRGGSITASVVSPPIPKLGGASLFGTITASRFQRSDGVCCCEITGELGVSWNITRHVANVVQRVPLLGGDAAAELVRYFNVGASLGISGRGIVCPDCWDMCEWRLTGTVEAGRTPRFQERGDGFLHPNTRRVDVALGASGSVSGVWNFCTGDARIALSGTVNLGFKLRARNPIAGFFQRGRTWWEAGFNWSARLDDLDLFSGRMPALVPNVAPCS